MLSSTPVQCPEYLLEKAKQIPSTSTAVVNAGTQVAMQSAKLAYQHSLIKPVLVGDSISISRIAKEIDWNIDYIRIIDANNETEAAKIAVSLARENEVASLMKGNIHTDELLKAVLDKDLGLRTGSRLSHVFHMTAPGSNQPLCISDAVVNVLPSVATKLDIARNATQLFHALGNTEPKIAVLSATETATPSMPSSMEAAEVVSAARAGEVSGAIVDGPFAFDNAVSPAAARLKGVAGPVAGNADLLLVPNIETGNALFKLMVYFMSAAAAGVVLGAKVPIILTSRADPAEARLAATALASIYASNIA